jgi:hypothetical protein
MQANYSLPVIHPAFEMLKRSAKLLHFVAASSILLNAIEEFKVGDINMIFPITELIIAVDIIILVFFTGQVLTESPKMNLLFRFIESLALLGIAINMAVDGQIWISMVHFTASFGYFYLLHREVRVIKREAINIAPTGIILPNLIKDAEIGWNEIKNIIPKYHTIIIETFKNKKIELNLRRNLKIDEMEQINEFCQKHLAVGS